MFISYGFCGNNERILTIQKLSFVPQTPIGSRTAIMEMWSEMVRFKEGHNMSLRRIRGFVLKAIFVLLMVAGLWVLIGAGRQFFLDESNSNKTHLMVANMDSLRVAVQHYRSESDGTIPLSADSFGERLSGLKNPWTGLTGEGEAWVTGIPTRAGQISYAPNDSLGFVILGYDHEGLFTGCITNRGWAVSIQDTDGTVQYIWRPSSPSS